MSQPLPEAHSSEDARERAQYHRHQISDTLDQLSDRISGTLDTAERQLHKPVNLVRAYPLAALGASLAIGFFVSASTTRRRGRKVFLAEQLANAYYEGRRDEQEQRSLRDVKYWQNPTAHERPRLFHSTFFELAAPVLRTIAGRWASAMFDRGRY